MIKKLLSIGLLLCGMAHAGGGFDLGGYQPYGDNHWKAPVASEAALPAVGNIIGDTRIETTDFVIYSWNGSTWLAQTSGGGGSGTVTSVSVSSADGFSGSVTNPTTTPAITIGTTVNGIMYSTGGALYQAIASNFPTLNQNTTGNAATATAFASIPSGCSSGLYATAISANGNLTCSQVSTGSISGSITAAQMYGLANGDIYVGNGAGIPAAVVASGDLTISNTGVHTLSTVNSNVGTYSLATVTVNGKGLITSASQTSSISGSQMYGLTNGDVYVGNGAGIPAPVAVSGDLALSNSGVATLSTVNSNVGMYTNATVTVNAKGLITAVSSGSSGTPTYNTATCSNTCNLSAGTTTSLNASTGSFTATLPVAASYDGQPVIFYRSDATPKYLLPIVPNGSDTFVNNNVQYQLNDQGSGLTCISISSAWSCQ